MATDMYRVIFLGPSGMGKTSTIRTLLRVADSKDTNSAKDAGEAQKTHRVHSEVLFGRKITVVDTPGLSNISDTANIVLELERSFRTVLPGPHVISLVFSIGTAHDVIRKTCSRYYDSLGESVSKHTAVLFTGLDVLDSGDSNFQKYIDMLPSDIKQRVGNRPLAFNNKANAPLIDVLQVKELLTRFDQIYSQSFGLYYQVKQIANTNVNYTEALDKNFEVLERDLSEPPSEELFVTNGKTADERKPHLMDDSHNRERDLHSTDDLVLQSITHREPESQHISDDVSMSSEKDSNTCGCWSGMSRKLRLSRNEPEFTQFS